MFLWNWFKHLGAWIRKGLKYAHDRGLTDAVVEAALGWVRFAADKFVDNAERREFVVGMLVARGVPEAVARLAVEIAVAIYKKEG